MEKRFDMHIDLSRREEFREMECVNDVVKCALLSVPISTSTDPLLHRIHAQFDNIGETRDCDAQMDRDHIRWMASGASLPFKTTSFIPAIRLLRPFGVHLRGI
jgi:hypothetical protein